MPGPSSPTATSAQAAPPRERRASTCPPSGANLTAFERRLTKTCCSSSASPETAASANSIRDLTSTDLFRASGMTVSTDATTTGASGVLRGRSFEWDVPARAKSRSCPMSLS